MKSTAIIVALPIFLLSGSLALAQSGGSTIWTKAKAKKWFEGKEWLHGLALQPHKSINQLTFAQQYQLHQSMWDSAFAFFRQTDLQSLPVGKYPIVGDSVFASVTKASTKNLEDTKWESHRKYADIQYVINGEEKIGICPFTKAKVTEAYDAKTDVAHYAATGSVYLARPGTFFIFFPADAHLPNITTGGNKIDKKLVIKVMVSGLGGK